MRRIIAVVLCLSVAGMIASAELLVNPSITCGTSEFQGGLNVESSSTEYEFSDFGLVAEGFEKTVDRITVTGYGAIPMNQWVDLFAAVGYILDSDSDFWDEEGSGFVVAGGVRARLWISDNVSVMGYAQVSYREEEYDPETWYLYTRSGSESFHGGTLRYIRTTRSNVPPPDGGPYETFDVEPSLTLTEVCLGAVLCGQYDKLTLYGGVEFIPSSDGELESSEMEMQNDLERVEVVGVKLGAKYDLANMFLTLDGTLITEETIRVGLGKVF